MLQLHRHLCPEAKTKAVRGCFTGSQAKLGWHEDGQRAAWMP